VNPIGCIYKFINLINGKIYIGQTIEKNPLKRIKKHYKKQKHKSLVYDAINKYGKENLIYEIIYYSFDMSDLNSKEVYFINHFNSLIPNGYNIKIGGEQGGKLLEETKIFIGKQIKEYYKTHSNPFKGKTFSKSHIEALSKVRKGFTSKNRVEARQKAKYKVAKKILAINIKESIEICFRSIADCAITLNLDGPCISRTCDNKQNRKQHKGWKFQWIIE
jgi:group I intron endonuclease